MNQEIKDEIKRLKKLRSEWIDFDPEPVKVTDTISDIEFFRNNTHEKFKNANSFYFSHMQWADTFFEDAADELQTYLESNFKYKQALENANEQIDLGIDHLVERLEKM
jgi:hypothetical protein